MAKNVTVTKTTTTTRVTVETPDPEPAPEPVPCDCPEPAPPSVWSVTRSLSREEVIRLANGEAFPIDPNPINGEGYLSVIAAAAMYSDQGEVKDPLPLGLAVGFEGGEDLFVSPLAGAGRVASGQSAAVSFTPVACQTFGWLSPIVVRSTAAPLGIAEDANVGPLSITIAVMRVGYPA